jgi:hypothetical protein
MPKMKQNIICVCIYIYIYIYIHTHISICTAIECKRVTVSLLINIILYIDDNLLYIVYLLQYEYSEYSTLF